MADPFRKLIAALEGVKGGGSEDWGAQVPHSRLKIREAVVDAHPEDDPEVLKDLSQHPRPLHRSISISHTHDFGGWLSIARPAQIGWDIELKSRIRMPVIERVCTREEIEKAPKPFYLWAAKEAFYKALEDDQPDVIMQLSVAEWAAGTGGIWSWRGLGPRNGEGVLIDQDPWILAACIVK